MPARVAASTLPSITASTTTGCPGKAGAQAQPSIHPLANLSMYPSTSNAEAGAGAPFEDGASCTAAVDEGFTCSTIAMGPLRTNRQRRVNLFPTTHYRASFLLLQLLATKLPP